jgi:hypothetical protein
MGFSRKQWLKVVTMPRGENFRGKKLENSGRKPGQPNHLTVSVKQAFGEAFDKMGGAQALLEWGKKNPTDFYKLSSKLIPTEVAGQVKTIVEYVDPTRADD